MKKTFMFMKTLLMAAGLLVGQSVWADVTPYSESFNSESTTTGWSTATSGRFDPVILNEGTDEVNYFLSVNQGNRNNNGTTVTGTVVKGKAVAGDDFTITFDLKLSSSTNQQPTSFTIKDAAGSGTFFSLTATGTWATSWRINGTDTQVTLPNSNKGNGSNTINDVTWCSYQISRSGNLTYLTITNKESGTVIFEQALVSGSSETGGLGNIVFVSSRYLANFAIDNIVVRDVQNGDVPTTSTADYTINYKLGDATVKTISGTNVVDAVITADVAIDGEGDYAGNHYLITAENAPSMTLVAGSNTLDVPVRAPYTATLAVTTTINGNANVENIALVESDSKSCAWSYPYSKYVKSGDIYYLCDETTFVHSGTFANGDVIEQSVSYSKADENIVYYREAESVAGNDPNCSWGGGGHIDAQNKRDRGISVGTLPAGTYLFTANILGDNRRSVAIRESTNDPLASVGTSNEDHSTGVKSALFMLTEETSNLWINGANSGTEKTNQSEDYDYVLIKKINSMSIVGDFSENGWNTQSGIAMTQSTENPAEWTAVVNDFVVTSDKYSYDYKAVANENFNDYVLPSGDNKNYNFDYDGAREGIYTLTFTVNTTNNSVEMSIEKQPTATIYFINTNDWAAENIKAWVWDANNGNYNYTGGKWPGQTMTATGEQIDGKDVYSWSTYVLNPTPTTLIISNNGSDTERTGDQAFVDGAYYKADGSKVTVSKTISAAGYATYYSDKALNFAGTGLTAYIAKAGETKDIEFVEVASVPANTGVLLKGTAGEYNIPVIASADEVIGNLFEGVLENTEKEAGIFVLMATPEVGFYKTTNAFTVGANTAYIPADVVEGRSFIAIDDDNTTSISNVNVNLNDNMVYNLRGQRVAQPTKGLYIVNGKKVVIK